MSRGGVNGTRDGETFDWTSDIPVQTVIVKDGPNANVYSYGSPGSTGGSGLHAPVNPENDEYPDLSHVDFCYVPTAPPTTAPPTTAPPTTEPPTTEPGVTATTQPGAPPVAQRAPAPTRAPAAPVVVQPSFTG